MNLGIAFASAACLGDIDGELSMRNRMSTSFLSRWSTVFTPTWPKHFLIAAVRAALSALTGMGQVFPKFGDEHAPIARGSPKPTSEKNC